VASGQERRRFVGHRDWVHHVDFAPDGERLASASQDGTALVWRLFDPAPAERSAAGLDVLWAELLKDGTTAHKAMGGLIAAKGTTPFLTKRLAPAGRPTEEQVTRWLTDLGSPQYQTRIRAQKELTQHADLIESQLRRAAEKSSELEIQRRLLAIVKDIPFVEKRPEQLRHVRAVEVLAHIRSPEARRLLQELAQGAPESILTRQAQACLNCQEGK
jgi:hypothetical protein